MDRAEEKEAMRESLLGEIGQTPIRDYTLEEEEETPTEEVEDSEEEVVEVKESPEEVEEDEDEGEEEEETGEEDPDDLLLRRAEALVFQEGEKEIQKAETPGEIESLRQQVDLLTKAILSSSVEAEREIVQPQVESGPEEFKIDATAPEIIKVLTDQGIPEEEARSLLPALVGIAEFVGDNKYGKRIELLQKKNDDLAQSTTQARQNSTQVTNLQTGLTAAKSEGGLEAKIVNDFISAGKQGRKSLLSEHFRKFPTKLDSPSGVLDAVVSVARSAQLLGMKNDKDPVITGNRKSVSAALGKATNTLQQKPKKGEEDLSPEEQIKADILSAGRNSRKLPEAFFG